MKEIRKGQTFMKLFRYLCIVGAITADVAYHFSEKNIPKDINPLFTLAIVYLAVSILALIMSCISNKGLIIITQLSKANWTIITLSISIIVMDICFLLSYRIGGELSKLYNIVTPLESILLVFAGVILYSEKLNAKIILGIVFAMIGITMLSI